MGEPSQIVFIDPPETVVFSGNVTKGKAMSTLLITNPTNKYIFFKVKTTKPLRYCVSPALGKLEDNTNIELIIKIKERGLQPEELKNDKFLIQTMYQEMVPSAGEDAVAAVIY